jgi:hypothetical protein
LTSPGTLTNKIVAKAPNSPSNADHFETLVREERGGAPRPPMPIGSR